LDEGFILVGFVFFVTSFILGLGYVFYRATVKPCAAVPFKKE